MKVLAEITAATGRVEAITCHGIYVPDPPPGRFFVELESYAPELAGKKYELVNGQHTFADFEISAGKESTIPRLE
ncbi:MAG: hypothetical protein AB7I36_20620 [Rhodospirillaceae bacterium]